MPVKAARRARRRILWPALLGLGVLWQWGLLATDRPGPRDLTDVAVVTLLLTAGLGVIVGLDLRRSLRVRRRFPKRTGGDSLRLYFHVELLLIAAFVAASLGMLVGLIPPPETIGRRLFLAAAIVGVTLQTAALAAAAWQVPRLLRRLNRPWLDAAFVALVLPIAAGAAATGCCVLPDLMGRSDLSTWFLLVAGGGFWLALWSYEHLRDAIGLAPPPPRPKTRRKRGRRVLVVREGEGRRIVPVDHAGDEWTLPSRVE